MNYMLEDLLGALIGVSLFPLFLVVPGFVTGWITNVLQFRQRRPVMRLLLSLVLSLAVDPVASFVLARTGSFALVWAGHALAWLAAGILLGWMLLRGRRIAGPVPIRLALPLAVGAGWVVLALLSLIDIQIGKRVYYTVVSVDYMSRVRITDAITHTGLPPLNPSYHPGYPVELTFYFHYWYVVCSLVDQIGGGLVLARTAFIAGSVWSGAGLIALIAVYLRLRAPGPAATRQASALLGVLLLLVTGLDIIPSLANAGAFLIRDAPVFNGDIEHWNNQITAWLGAMLWAPHHVAGLVACLVAWTIVSVRDAPPRSRLTGAVVAGFALASAAGLSPHVTLIFVGYWLLRLLWLVLRPRQRWELAFWVIPGVVAGLLSLPFLVDLLGSDNRTGDSLTFAVRRFSPAVVMMAGEPNAINHLVNLAFLPLNYLLELGFFALVAVAIYAHYRRHPRALNPWTGREALLLAISVLISTLIDSSSDEFNSNDLGWRGFMPAQFVLLIWGVDVVLALFGDRFARRGIPPAIRFDWGPRVRRGLVALLAVGVLSTGYDLFLLRSWTVLSDAGLASLPNRFTPDRQLGARTYAARQAYEALGDAFPYSTVIQPSLAQNAQIPAGLYARQRIAVGVHTRVGIDPDEYYAAVGEVNRFYFHQLSGLSELDQWCQDLAIDLVIITNSDPNASFAVELARQRPPFFGSVYVMVLPCGDLAAEVPP
jgi:hypothetical protein